MRKETGPRGFRCPCACSAVSQEEIENNMTWSTRGVWVFKPSFLLFDERIQSNRQSFLYLEVTAEKLANAKFFSL